MAAVATPEPMVAVNEPPAAERPARRLFEPGGVSLEESILGIWEDLVANGCAGCPVCGGQLTAGACEGCGAELR